MKENRNEREKVKTCILKSVFIKKNKDIKSRSVKEKDGPKHASQKAKQCIQEKGT